MAMDKPRDESYLKKRKLKRIVLAAVVVVVAGSVSAWIYSLEPAARKVERETVWLGTVERGEMVRQVRGPGTLVPEEIQWISAVTDGTVVRKVELPGVEVAPDSIILVLSNPELEQQSQTAELDLQAGESGLTDLTVRLQSELLNQQADAARVRSDYEEAKLDAAAQEELSKEGLTPEIDLKRAKLREQQLAGRNLIEEQRLDKKRESVEAQLASERLRVRQLRTLLDLRRSQVDQLKVRAGIAGVLQEVPVVVGQRVAPGTSLALVANPAVLKAELQIPQVQAKDLLLGQKAEIDTRNGLVPGKVKRIDPAVRDGTVTVDVELAGELPRGARPDLSVEGTVEIERLEDVLYVGRPAYGQANSKIELFKVLPDGMAVRVPVQLGRSSVNTIEIVEGLKQGDQVILSDTSAYDGEDRIRLD
jgi:HlyD family secretion protein